MGILHEFEKTKLHEVLTLLGQKQLNDLKHFINLSGNNLTERQKLVLIELIEHFSRDKMVNERKLSQKYYGNDLQYWPKAKTHIINAVMRYLKFQAIEKEEFLTDFCLLEFFGTQKCTKNFNALYKKINTNIVKQRRNANTKYNRPEFKGIATTLIGEYKLLLSRTVRNEESIRIPTRIIKGFTEYYVVTQIRLVIELINRQLTVRKKVNYKDIYEYNFIVNYKTNNLQILVYQYMLRLITAKPKQVENLYFATRSFIIKNANEKDKEDFIDFFKLLTNYCFGQIKGGNYKFAKMAWLNYMYLIDKNLLLEDTGLTPYSYLNLVLLGLKLRKLKQVAQLLSHSKILIDKSNPALKKAVDKIALVTSLCHQAKTKKDLQKCLRKIRAFKYDDEKLNIQINKLLIKIYFDLKQPKKAIAVIAKNNTKDEKLINFYAAIKNLFVGKRIKDFKPANFQFLDFGWLKKRQQKLK